MRLDFDGDGLQAAVVAVASALPVTVAHAGRCAESCHATQSVH